MHGLPELSLALAAVALVVSLSSALRRAGGRATAFAGLVVANLGLCGLALRHHGTYNLLLWAALAGALLLVGLPHLLSGAQAKALSEGRLQDALRLQRWRNSLQHGVHVDGLHALEELSRHSVSASGGLAFRREGPGWVRELLRPHLDPGLRLLLLEILFDELAAAGRGEELLALLEEEGRESLLGLSPRIARTVDSFIAGTGRLDLAAGTGSMPPPSVVIQPRQARAARPPRPLVTIVLVLAIAAVHGLLMLSRTDDGTTLLRWGGNYRPLTLHGEPWRLLSSVFLHGGLLHILVNAYALYNLGRLVEPLYGASRFFTIFMLAGLSGAAASALLGNPERLSVGASGAIFGLLGAALIALLRLRGIINERWRRQVLYNLLIIIALNLWIGYSVAVVDNLAHAGGLTGGLLVGLWLAVSPGRPASRASSLASGALATVLLVALVVTVAVVVMTPFGHSLLRMPWHTISGESQSIEVPISTTRDQEANGLVLRDPVLRMVLIPEVGPADGKRSISDELADRMAVLRGDFRTQPAKPWEGDDGAIEVTAIEAPGVTLPQLTTADGAQGAVQVRRDREKTLWLLLLRRDHDRLLQLMVTLPTAQLEDAAPLLRRSFASFR